MQLYSRLITMATQLPHLPEVERLSASCIRILGGNPGKFTLQGTNTYLVGTGSSRLLVDTGEGKPSWIGNLRRVLTQEKATVEKALITHWHPDHVSGIPQLLEYSPRTTVHKCNPGSGQLDIADGQVFKVDGATLVATHAPGHTTDHMVFVLREEDAVFTGDNVLGHGTAVYEDLGVYLQTLGKMEKLVAGRGYPGHGVVIPEARVKIAEYISHRQQRETQVLQTLASPKKGYQGSTSNGAIEPDDGWMPMELVKVIYRDVPENLHLPALGGIMQILGKLQAEDKVTVGDGEKWRLTRRSSL